jgi:hypothetical protein
MKSIRATLFASALALVAGCSSGNSEPSPPDEAVKSSASLIAPSPGEPEDDPCASVRCAAGTECVVVDDRASCVETDVNPCAAVSCLVGTACEVIDGEATCTPLAPSACAAVLCPTGTTCDVVDDEPVCTPIPTSGPLCGGFAGLACPGSGQCVDDATDDCDPDNGGFDCGGVCECNIRALCIQGFAFDASPEVCACVEAPELDPCAAVRCGAGTECVVEDGSATCQPAENPCAAVLCEVGTICEVVDGAAVCSPSQPSGPFCGGFANIQCPGAGVCQDDPSDGCNPDDGGADCGGICECNSLALCIEGFIFDDSADVCECVPVPETNPCALVDCFPNLICQVVEGEAVCVEPGPNPCAAVLCAPDTICVADGDEARCVPVDHDCN